MRGLYLPVAVLSLGALAVSACGSSTPSQADARDQATTTSCDLYQRCNQIGTGQMYSSRDDCDIKVRSFYEGIWTAADCMTISSTGLDNCLTTIRIADCTSLVDGLSVLSKCSKMNVCGKP